MLQAKGHREPSSSSDASSDCLEKSQGTLAMKPSDIVANLSAEVDGVILIQVQSHFGINLTERTPDIMGPAISINAVASLVSVQNPEVLWRDKGMGRSYSESQFLRRTQFLIQLNQAVRSLVDNLFYTASQKRVVYTVFFKKTVLKKWSFNV